MDHTSPSLPVLLLRLITLCLLSSLSSGDSITFHWEDAWWTRTDLLFIHFWVFSAQPTFGGFGIKWGKLGLSFFGFVSLSILSALPCKLAHLGRTKSPEPTASTVCRIHRSMRGDRRHGPGPQSLLPASPRDHFPSSCPWDHPLLSAYPIDLVSPSCLSLAPWFSLNILEELRQLSPASLSHHMKSHWCHFYEERPQLAIWKPIPKFEPPLYGPHRSTRMTLWAFGFWGSVASPGSTGPRQPLFFSWLNH